MIETIEYFASTQSDFPVYDCLGQQKTYGQLKEDSDSIAAYIESLNLAEKSPVLVFGGQTYDMLATFVALTKTGHAYIPVDVHSATDRIMSIIEVGQPSLIIAIEELPLEVASVKQVSFNAIENAKKSEKSISNDKPCSR